MEKSPHETAIDEEHASKKLPTSVELQDLGIEQQTARYIGGLEILSEGYNICNSWAASVSTLALVLSQGGSVVLLYGLILTFVAYGCIVFTLAELASVYPSAGGQYHWTSILAPKSCKNVLSYACGITNVFSWTAIWAGVNIIIPQILLGLVKFWQEDYEIKQWHTFLVYVAFDLLVVLHNIFAIRKTMWIFTIGFFLSMILFVVVLIACVARSETKQSSAFVWTEFINETGWSSNGVVFFLGLVNPMYIYIGIDGAIHLAEECANATTAVPRALMSTWLIGFVTSFAMAIAVMYSVSDFDAVVSTPTGFPILEAFSQATRSKVAATIFVAIILLLAPVALTGIAQTASRLTWSFARDNALILSTPLGHMHPTFQAPCWSLIANGLIVLVIGCVYLGSIDAFYSIITIGVILQLVAFAFPAALIMLRRRSAKYLPRDRAFRLPSVVGWVSNFFTVAIALVGVVFYDFPTVLPVTAGNMNYACAVIGVMALFAVVNWFVWARKHYRGPAIS